MSLALGMLASLVCHAQGAGRLENESLVWQWNLTGGTLSSTLKTKDDSFALELANPGFQVTLGDGTILSAADFKLLKPAHTDNLHVEPDSSSLARHFAGSGIGFGIRQRAAPSVRDLVHEPS